MKTFIIFGGHGYNTQGVIECMATNNMDFFLLLVRGSRVYSVTLKSKYVTKYKEVNSVEEGVIFLLDYKTDLAGSVIYPTSDAAESVLDLNYAYLLTYADISTGDIYAEFLDYNEDALVNKILTLNIKELILKKDFNEKIVNIFKNSYSVNINYSDELYDKELKILENISDERV